MYNNNDLLKLILNKEELYYSLQGLNKTIINTYRECCEYCLEQTLNYEESYLFKIDAVVDYLHDELNTGHWSDVPISIRQAFTSASFLKAMVILKSPTSSIQVALKSVDRGILLGAPLNANPTLLTATATVLSKGLNYSLQNELQETNKRKYSNTYKNSYELLKGKEITTLECPSLETFNKTCFLPEIPAKLQGCISHWPASTKWLDVNYLLNIAGNRTVPIEIGSHYAEENWSQKLMTLRDFIKNHYFNNSSVKGYLAQHNLFDQITELKDDICIPDYCGLSRDYEMPSEEPDINAWFGPEGTLSPLHFDPKDNLLVQVYGVKQVLLFAPSDSEYLYPHQDKLLFNTARVNPIEPDSIEYPNFYRASPFKCLLEAGEILYIPRKWWHHISSLAKSFSVSFWWQ